MRSLKLDADTKLYTANFTTIILETLEEPRLRYLTSCLVCKIGILLGMKNETTT